MIADAYITIETSNTTARVRCSDITFIERDKRKVRIVTELEVYEYYEKMKNIEPLLDRRFFPCLKGLYINLDKVVSMREQKITFEGGQVLFLGRDNFVRCRQYYQLYLKNPVS